MFLAVVFPRRFALLRIVLLIAALSSFNSLLTPTTAGFAQSTVPDQYDVSHLAGGPGGAGYLDGTGLQARFNGPTGLWGIGGNLYVADSGERTIRKIVAATGEVSTISRLDSSLECTGPGLRGPFGVRTLISRNLSLWADAATAYVADDCLHVIYKMALSSGESTVLSGQLQQSGSHDGTAAEARFTFPKIMWADDSYLYVQDTVVPPYGGRTIIRRVDKQTGGVTQVFSNIAGNIFSNPSLIEGSLSGDGTYLYSFATKPVGVGTVMQLLRIDTGDVKIIDIPSFVYGEVRRRTEGSEDFLYLVANRQVLRIRVSTGETATFAGGIGSECCTQVVPADGPGAAASFSDVAAVWGDNDYLYVVEPRNNTVRKIRFSTAEVTTVLRGPSASRQHHRFPLLRYVVS